MALVSRRQERRESDLLAAVGGVNIHDLVVNTNAGVGVVGGDGDLHGGRDGSRWHRRDVQAENGDVLENEAGLGRPEDSPDEEDD